jgi:hypothetical protein
MIKNRYGDEWCWEKQENNIYKFIMTGTSMEFCRYGGIEGVSGIDKQNLGMFDPSGGPYISLGQMLEGKEIVRLRHTDGSFYAEVANENT